MNTLMKRNSNGQHPASSFTGMVDRIFQENLSRFFDGGADDMTKNMRVPVNLKETDKSYEMEVVAPGLKKEDFNVHLTGDTLTVSFEQQQESSANEEGWIHNEYRLRSFSRSFRLDDTVDTNKVTAEYRDGILHMLLPKKEDAQRAAKTIEVK